MKKLLFPLVVALATLGFAACNDGPTQNPEPDPIPATGVSLYPTSDLIEIGDEIALSPTITPSNATNKEVTWTSSAENIASVSAEGIVKGVTEGEATITVTTVDGSHTATFAVEVREHVEDVASVSLDIDTKTIAKNGEYQLTPVFVPANATDKRVTWESLDPAIATVTENGLVKGVRGGITRIKITTRDGNLTAESEVIVDVPLTGISLEPSTVNIMPGATTQVQVVYTPEDALNKNFKFNNILDGTVARLEYNADDPTVINVIGVWSSSTEWRVVADEMGANGEPIETRLYINVLRPVTSVVFSPTSYSINAGATLTLAPTVNPANASDKTLTWSSNNEDVATVDADGVVTGVATGSAVITATAVGGNNVKGTCTVTVKGEHPVFGFVTFKSDATWSVTPNDGRTYTFSDYVMASRCKTNVAQFNATSEDGDCLSNGDSYSLFSYNAIAKYATDASGVLCPDGWKATTQANYQQLTFQRGAEFAAWKESFDFGGYFDGTAIVQKGNEDRIWLGPMMRLGGDPNAAWMGNAVYTGQFVKNGANNFPAALAVTTNMAFGWRCVKVSN